MFEYTIFVYKFAQPLYIYSFMTKQERHKAIKEIIAAHEIECQEDLLSILTDKGFELTQATLSRDMKEMKIIKVPTDQGHYIYQLSENISSAQSETSRLSAFGFVGIEFSGNLAVVKTRPGYAMAIAGEIDSKIKNEIIGTVAGDDTILLIIREGIKKEEVLRALSEFIRSN